MEDPAPYGNMTFTPFKIKTDQLRRERIAIAAMQGMLAHGLGNCSPDHIASRAIDYAEELIRQLDTRNGNPDYRTAEGYYSDNFISASNKVRSQDNQNHP